MPNGLRYWQVGGRGQCLGAGKTEARKILGAKRPTRLHALLGFVIMFHRYDYISLFVSCFDIPVSLGNLFQRVASIDDRFYLPRFNKLFEEN